MKVYTFLLSKKEFFLYHAMENTANQNAGKPLSIHQYSSGVYRENTSDSWDIPQYIT